MLRAATQLCSELFRGGRHAACGSHDPDVLERVDHGSTNAGFQAGRRRPDLTHHGLRSQLDVLRMHAAPQNKVSYSETFTSLFR